MMGSKNRSPNYPALTLPQAVEAARKLWDAEKRAPVSNEAAALAMGYKSLSGPARVAIGAMRQYGLIDKAEKGHIRISDRGVMILHGDEADRKVGLAEAALAPPLFNELMAANLEDASENNIRSYLMTRKKFMEDGARKAAKAFREAVLLATDGSSGYTAQEKQEKPQAMAGIETVQTTKAVALHSGEVERVRVSLKGGRLARIVFSGDVPTQADIQKVIASLELQKDSFPEGD